MAKPGGALPSKQQILDYIQSSQTPVGKREIARAFQVKGALRADLRAMLKELEEEGAIDRGRKRKMAPKGALPEVSVLQVEGYDEDGDLLARPTGPHSDSESRVVVVAGGRRQERVKPGDRVLARMKRVGAETYEAQVIRILNSGAEAVLGVLSRSGRKWYVNSTDRRADKTYTLVKRPEEVDEGDLVLVRPLAGRGAEREAELIERVGNLEDPKAFSLIAIHQNGIPVEFPDAALAEADKFKKPTLGKRVDLRAMQLVTIDGADARDFDDAVHAEPDTDPDNPGGFRLTVAIADVAAYVTPGSALDRAARPRGNSVYFPDRVVPMLPERLSNDLCSLRPNEDRFCLACHMVISSKGKLLSHRFVRGLMRSAARLTYDQVQAARDGIVNDQTAPLVDDVITPLYQAFFALNAGREARGTLELDLPERQVRIGENGKVAEITRRDRLDSHRLIEEFMITANVAAAEALEAKQPQSKLPIMYRVHESPPLDKLEGLRESLAVLGYNLAKGAVIKPIMLTGILEQAAKDGKADLVSDIMLRSQAQAIYTGNNAGHFGLALRRYCHFTSPIRRYSDVLVHRALISNYGLGEGGMSDTDIEEFDDTAELISGTERRAAAAERDALERYVSAYMAEQVGTIFPARISGVARFGLFVALEETGAEGLIPVSTLPNDYYDHDEVHRCLVGRDTNTAFTLSDKIRVRLVEANPVTGGLVFEVVEGGKTASKGAGQSTGRGGKRRVGTDRKGPRGGPSKPRKLKRGRR